MAGLHPTYILSNRCQKEMAMDALELQTTVPGALSDPEWIALESLDEDTDRFIFEDGMLDMLKERGLVEPRGDRWRITAQGRRALTQRVA